MLPIVLSFGAVEALVPLLIIIILIAAAAGLTRGWDALGKLFGISILAGIGAGSAARGSLAGKGKLGVAAGKAAGAGMVQGGSLARGALQGAASNYTGSEAALNSELAAMGGGGGGFGTQANFGAQLASAGAQAANAASTTTSSGFNILGASRPGIAGIPKQVEKGVKMAVKGLGWAGGKAKSGVSILAAPKGTKSAELVEKGQKRVAGAFGLWTEKEPFSAGMKTEITEMTSQLKLRSREDILEDKKRKTEEYQGAAEGDRKTRKLAKKKIAELNEELTLHTIYERRLGLLRKNQRRLEVAKEAYLKTHDLQAFKNEFKAVWKATQGRGKKVGDTLMPTAGGLLWAAMTGDKSKSRRERIYAKYGSSARWKLSGKPAVIKDKYGRINQWIVDRRVGTLRKTPYVNRYVSKKAVPEGAAGLRYATAVTAADKSKARRVYDAMRDWGENERWVRDMARKQKEKYGGWPAAQKIFKEKGYKATAAFILKTYGRAGRDTAAGVAGRLVKKTKGSKNP